MAAEPMSPLDVLKDPFAESADSYHISVLPSLGWEWHLPEWLSKFMILETISALIVMAVFLPVARRLARGEAPRGRRPPLVEWIRLFVRGEVATPTIGEHDYKRFLPLLWTMFVFITTMNLLGMIPYMGSPTASIAVTGVLALVAFLVIHYNGISANEGFGKYVKTFKVHLDREGKLLQIMAPVIEF